MIDREVSVEDPRKVAVHRAEVELTRGPYGGRPLFYAIDRDVVLVSSSLAPLVSKLVHRPAVRNERLASLITVLPMGDPGSTHYAGIYRVPSDHSVHVSPNGTRRHVREVKRIGPVEGAITAEDAACEIRRLIRASVARAIAGEKHVAVLAGGGVDSSGLLAAAMAEARGATPTEVHAVTLHFAGRGDDRPYMRDLAEALRIVPVRMPPREGGAFVRRALVLDDTPFQGPDGGIFLALMKNAAECGADRVLMGAGGDDLFDGDARIFADQARSGQIVQAVLQASRLRSPAGGGPFSRVRDTVLRPLVARLLPHGIQQVRRRRVRRNEWRWAGPELRVFLDDVVVADAPPSTETPTERLSRFRGASHFTEAADERAQIELSSGVERVDPYLDDALVEFVMRLPPAMLLHGSRMRGLFRLALKGMVPDSVRFRTDKADFEVALTEMVEAAGGFSSFDDLVAMPALAALGLVEPRGFRRAFDALAHSPLDGERWVNVWPALAVEAFAQSHAGIARC